MPCLQPADRQAPDVVVVVEVVALELRRRLSGRRAGRAGPENQLEQRAQVVAGLVQVARRRAGAGVGVDDGEVELLLAGVEVDEEVVDLVQHLGDARVGAVDLVDADDRRQPGLERLLEHEAGLRQRPLGGVDQQHDAVDHRQRALDLAAEVGVAGRVDDVDLHAAVVDGGVLGQDGDAALALEIEGVHDPLHHLLVGAEDAALMQHGVDQRRLAVIDVGDDGDVANVRRVGWPQPASCSVLARGASPRFPLPLSRDIPPRRRRQPVGSQQETEAVRGESRSGTRSYSLQRGR